MARKRKSGTGTIRQRKDGRWEGRAVVGYDDKGLPKTKNVLAKSKHECQEKLTKLMEAVGNTKSEKIRADMPFGEWVDFWYQTYVNFNGVYPFTSHGIFAIRLYIIKEQLMLTVIILQRKLAYLNQSIIEIHFQFSNVIFGHILTFQFTFNDSPHTFKFEGREISNPILHYHFFINFQAFEANLQLCRFQFLKTDSHLIASNFSTVFFYHL